MGERRRVATPFPSSGNGAGTATADPGVYGTNYRAETPSSFALLVGVDGQDRRVAGSAGGRTGPPTTEYLGPVIQCDGGRPALAVSHYVFS